MVLPISALLTGASSTKPDLKLGPIAAMKFMVSARLKLPCMPWPCCKPVSATSTVHSTGWSQPVEKERKLTTIAGRGVRAEPFRLIADIGSVPGKRPSVVIDEEAADVVLREQRLDHRAASVRSLPGR